MEISEKEKISFSTIIRELRIHCLLFLEYRQKGDTKKVQIQLKSIKQLGLRIETYLNSIRIRWKRDETYLRLRNKKDMSIDPASCGGDEQLSFNKLGLMSYVATLYEKIDLLSDDEKADEVADQIILNTLNLEKAILDANLYKITSETTQKLLTERRVYD